MFRTSSILSQPSQFTISRVSRLFAFSALAASLSLIAIPRAGAAQDPADSSQQQQPQSQQQPDNQPAPPPAQHDQRRVISRDTISQDSQNGQDPQDPEDQDQNAPRHRRPSHDRPYQRSQVVGQAAVGNVPDSITIPAGR